MEIRNYSADADRRQYRRYRTDFAGRIESAGLTCAVALSDLSTAGALVTAARIEALLAPGADVTLVLDGFGTIPARVVHVDNGSCGVEFIGAQQRLLEWLCEEVGA